ncbi:MAG: radical SAM protein [Candidatus Omnitrophota bacterium]
MPDIDALLINPISARVIPAFVPHGLLYIAAYAIRRGYKMRIYDRNTEEADLGNVLKGTNPKVVGLGCLTGTSIDDAIRVSKEVRNINPAIKIVWGGIHTSLYPESILKEDFVDFVVVGDGEEAFCGIMDCMIGNSKSLEAVDNLGYKVNGQLKYNKQSFVDPSDLPQPSWHLIDVKKYMRRKFYAKKTLTINTSRGCPYKCAFCCVPKVHQGKWRAISAEKIVENLKFLRDNYKIDGFQVDDDEFDIDRERVLRFCDLLQGNGLRLKWSHFSRINILKEEVLRREISCGLSLIEFGVESGSPRMLKFLNKAQTVEQVRRAYVVCRKLHIKTSALFMVGLPTEEVGDLKETVRLIKQLNPHLTICTIFKPYPGTEFFDYCIDKGLFRYPDKIEEIGCAYNLNINVSTIPDKTIYGIKRHFDFNNIYQEILSSVFTGNFGLIVYYFRFRLIPDLKGRLRNYFYPRDIKI